LNRVVSERSLVCAGLLRFAHFSASI
jgi:hypothetical protein